MGHRFIPVVENGTECRLALHARYGGAKDGGHAKQRGKASAEADAAKRGENHQSDHSQAKANEHLGRSQF